MRVPSVLFVSAASLKLPRSKSHRSTLPAAQIIGRLFSFPTQRSTGPRPAPLPGARTARGSRGRSVVGSPEESQAPGRSARLRAGRGGPVRPAGGSGWASSAVLAGSGIRPDSDPTVRLSPCLEAPAPFAAALSPAVPRLRRRTRPIRPMRAPVPIKRIVPGSGTGAGGSPATLKDVSVPEHKLVDRNCRRRRTARVPAENQESLH